MSKAKKKARGGARKARGVAKEVAVKKIIGGKTREVEAATVETVGSLGVVGKRKAAKSQFKAFYCKDVPLTMDLANKLIKMEEGVWERDLRINWVVHLTEEMEKGIFIWEAACLAFAICKWDGKERRLNGHHTAQARTLFVGKFDKSIRLTKYRIDTEEELRVLYSHLDRMAPRTKTHVLNCRLVGTSQFTDIPKSVLAKTTQGYGFWKVPPQDKKRLTVDEIAENLLTKDHLLALHHVIPHIRKTLNDKNLSFLRKSGVYAAMFETFNKVVSDSNEFWEQLQTGLGFTRLKDPVKKLREYIQTHVTSRSLGTTVNIVSMEEVYRGCIQAFNAFRDGRELGTIRPGQAGTRRPVAR